MHLPKNEGGDFELPPAGTFPARCYRFIDLGSHPQEYQGQAKGMRRLVMIGFELSDEQNSKGEPFTIHKRYTFSTHEKAAMRKDLEAWRGAKFNDNDFGPGGFDTKNLLGVPAVLTIVHNENEGKTYANIAGIGKAMKNMAVPELQNNPVYIALDPERFNHEAYDGLSVKLKDFIGESPEWDRLNGGGAKSDGYAAGKSGERRDLNRKDETAGPREFAPPADEDLNDAIPF